MPPSNDPSIRHEPQNRNPADLAGSIDGVDPPLDWNQSVPNLKKESLDDVQHSVWDEPAIEGIAGKATPNDLTFAAWLLDKKQKWSQVDSWMITLIIAALSGPWAVLLMLLNSIEFNRTNVVMVCFVVPLAQEVSKNAIALWVVERRPFFFTGWFQIFFCSLASATVFVAISQMINGYFFPPENQNLFLLFSAGMLLMHLITSTMSATGLEKIWRRAIFLQEPPRLEVGYRWFMAAFLINVAYSTTLFLADLIIRLF